MVTLRLQRTVASILLTDAYGLTVTVHLDEASSHAGEAHVARNEGALRPRASEKLRPTAHGEPKPVTNHE